MKWIEMMVKKLTARYMSLNKQFKVQRHTIVCQSGMEDYVSVTIDCTESFSFDFWTKELLSSTYKCNFLGADNKQ